MPSAFYTDAQKIERFMHAEAHMDTELAVDRTNFGLDALKLVTTQMQLSRCLREAFGPDYHFWVGFYTKADELLPGGRWMGEPYLYLGGALSDPGPEGHGCSIIPLLKGACGYAARTGKTVVIPNTRVWKPDDAEAQKKQGKTVEGIIHCSTHATSEIVVPVINQNGTGKLTAVLDIDSSLDPEQFATFDAVDQEQLERLVRKYFP